jgi:hypothetical protein
MSQRHAAMVCILLGTLPHLPRGPLGHQDQFLLIRNPLSQGSYTWHAFFFCPITPELGDVDAAVMMSSADILQAARNIATVDLATSAAPATVLQWVWRLRPWSTWHRRPTQAPRLCRARQTSHELGPSPAVAL